MKNYCFAFHVSAKGRTRQFGEMVAVGASVHGDKVEVITQEGFTEPLADFDGAAKLGLSRSCKRIMNTYLKSGRHFLFFDKGYTKREQYWRVSVDAWQPLAYFQRYMHASDRFNVSGPSIGNRRKSNPSKAIVFAGACQNYSNFFDLGNVNNYNERVLWALRENSDRRIIYRPNPSWYNKHNDEFRPIHEGLPNVALSLPDVPFGKELDRCHLLVTHGSSASVAALALGIPTMVLGEGICKPYSLQDDQWGLMEDPVWPKNGERLQFFYDLAYCQWTLEEYRNGAAWAEIRLALANSVNLREATPVPEVLRLLRQYQVMHKHPNYFRGLTTLKFARDIGKLVDRTDAHTVLDYGSGKGEQYERPHNLHKVWDVGVTCYDPGVAGISKLPDRNYDGVICCDVMEHVPEDDVQETLQRVIQYARKFVFLSIATDPATKTLPDGRNCHLTIKPREWWEEQVSKAAAMSTNNLEVVIKTSGNSHVG